MTNKQLLKYWTRLAIMEWMNMEESQKSSYSLQTYIKKFTDNKEAEYYSIRIFRVINHDKKLSKLEAVANEKV